MPSIHPHIPHHWARIQQGRGKRRVQDLANRPLHRVCTCGPARRDRTTFDHLSKCHQSQCQLHTASLKTCGCEMIQKARPGVLISQSAAKRCPSVKKKCIWASHISPETNKAKETRHGSLAACNLRKRPWSIFADLARRSPAERMACPAKSSVEQKL
jgi:hypothetical protein